MTTAAPADPGVNFRLSKDVMPRRYELQLGLDLEQWRQRGWVTISLDVRAPVDQITLHAIDLDITSARLAPAGDGQQIAPHALVTHPLAEAVTLVFDAPLAIGSATLTMEFSGEIVDKLRGLYRSVKGGARFAATQFEAADARRAFPCFDEPEFKARYQVTLIVPEAATAIANGAIEEERALGNGRKEVRFRETPPISSYLVAFVVGPFESTPLITTADGVPVQVWLPEGLAAKGLFANDAHARSLEYLTRYTGIAYPYGKVDAIGLADFEAGAMENPGAITYRLTAIAADAAQASTDTLKDIFYTAAHELTHMWWGDLVTMAWWNDLWLNESFATFVGWKCTAELVPEWGMWRDFVATLARPFTLDALVSTHPISFQVDNARQAAERFDVITYWKGAGVVRMLEAFLGGEVFRAGVHRYLERYAEQNATADDFWRELDEASGRDVTAIANAWIREPGHPLVGLTSTFDNGGVELALTQRRFYADADVSATAAPQRWPVPLLLKVGGATGVREERILLDDATGTATIADASWIYPNGGGAGFYRFALDDDAVARLAPAIADGLAPEERLNLIDNQWALVKAGAADIASFMTLLDGFERETDRAVLEAISGRLSWLESHALDDRVRPRFAALVERLFTPEFARLGWEAHPDESSDERMKRAAVVRALGRLADVPAVITEAADRITRYFEDRAAVEPNLAPVVAGLAARGGDATLYERYLARKRAASHDPEEEERFLLALTSFEHPELIDRTLALTFTDEVRAQDRAFLLAYLLAGRASRRPAWSFVRNGWETHVLAMDPMLRQYVIRAMGSLTPPDLATEVDAFLETNVTDETRETTAQAREQLRLDAAACTRIGPALTAVLGT